MAEDISELRSLAAKNTGVPAKPQGAPNALSACPSCGRVLQQGESHTHTLPDAGALVQTPNSEKAPFTLK